jgi:transcription elongation factor GreA
MSTESVWMTPAVLQQLRDELAELEGRTPTLEEQVRMRELRELVRQAEVAPKPDDGLVEPGMRVTIRFEPGDATATFLLGSRELVGLDPAVDVEVYSPTSPLGAAITGRYVGDRVSYTAPSGDQHVSIVSAVPFD